MLADTNDRRDIPEQYDSANNTSSLVVSERFGAADVLIAAGWSPSTVGGAIMRMHSEFSRPARTGGRTDVMLTLQQLKTLPAVIRMVGDAAAKWGQAHPTTKAREVILWWLDHSCPRCQGRGKQLIPGTPALSNRACPRHSEGGCGGTGARKLPHGEEGRRIANYMDSCVADWRGSMRKNLARVRPARNKVVDTPRGRVIIAAKDGTGR